MSDRAAEIDRFLADAGRDYMHREMLAGDASTRRYHRIYPKNHRPLILMDAPATEHASFQSFLKIDAHLRGLGLSAPEILASNSALGLILMEDLGDAVFAREIARAPQSEMALYERATDVTIALHNAPPAPGLCRYDARQMADFTDLAMEWYHLVPPDQKSAILAELETVLTPISEQQTAMALRDYHAENLIWLPDRAGVKSVGLLDFQDAMIAHPAYDLVSLLTDARRDVSRDVSRAMIERYRSATGTRRDALLADVAVLGVQRNLRILGIFARLSMKYARPGYVDLIPRVWRHLCDGLSHPALSRLKGLITRALPEPTPQKLTELRKPNA